jgi:hypothetical protein
VPRHSKCQWSPLGRLDFHCHLILGKFCSSSQLGGVRRECEELGLSSQSTVYRNPLCKLLVILKTISQGGTRHSYFSQPQSYQWSLLNAKLWSTVMRNSHYGISMRASEETEGWTQLSTMSLCTTPGRLVGKGAT